MVTLTRLGATASCAGDTQNPTSVTVIEGSAQVAGPGVSLDVGADQTATITGTDTFQGEVGPAQRDAFLTAMLDSERPPQPQGVAPPPVVAAMPGGEDLAAVRLLDRQPRSTARSGIRRSRRTGCPIARDAGPMSRRGAGPGWTAPRGVSRRSITAAGRRSAAAGAGSRRGAVGGAPAGLCARAGDLPGRRRRRRRRHRRRARRGAYRLVSARAARAVPSVVSCERPLLPAGQRRARDQLHHHQPQRHDQQLRQPRAPRRWCRPAP